jgi:SAM-dependent methyltransferase
MAMPLLDSLPLDAATWIVDVGAGTGAHLAPIAARAPRARVVAVDRAAGMLRLALQPARGLLAAMDGQALALRSGTFDVATLMLFHIPDPVTALREVRRMLRGNGFIGIVTWSRDDAMPGLNIWKEELASLGVDTGVRIALDDRSDCGHPAWMRPNPLNLLNLLNRFNRRKRQRPPLALPYKRHFHWHVDPLLVQ